VPNADLARTRGGAAKPVGARARTQKSTVASTKQRAAAAKPSAPATGRSPSLGIYSNNTFYTTTKISDL
jgi:hypothetical protein